MTDSKITEESSRNDNGGKKTIQGISELLEIPEIMKYFSQALNDAKKEFKDQIERYKKKSKEVRSGASKSVGETSKEISYFFELLRVTSPRAGTGHTWQLRNLKLPVDNIIKDKIFSDFKEKIDQYPTSNEYHKELVDLTEFGKTFKIIFAKSSNTRVVGFIKEVEEAKKKSKNGKEDFVLEDNTDVIKVRRNKSGWSKEEMRGKIIEFMDENPRAIEELFFSFALRKQNKV